MNIQLARSGRKRGSALIFTVLLMGLVTILVASYMTLVQNQNRSTMRSQAWNAAVPLIEAGIEEALAHLNHNGVTNLGNDGWYLMSGRYVKHRAVGDGFYIVGISNNGVQAVIHSQGYVTMPGVASAEPGVMLASVSSLLSGSHLGRGVEVYAKTEGLFAKGLVAKGKIDLKGNNIVTDSFDSSDAAYSTAGQYDASKRKDNGDVATNGGVVDSLSAGNAQILGHVATGPGGSIDIGATGTVGSATWHADGNTGIEPGYAKDDMNVSFLDPQAPFSGGADTPVSGTYDGSSVEYLVPSGNFQLESLSLSGDETMVITGNAVLYVTGEVAMSGTASIRILPGATLQIYVGGEQASLGGNGVINEGGNATNFTYYGLPSNRAVSIVGNGEFVGGVYAPKAQLSLSGSGRSSTDFIGAGIAASVTMNGNFNFHYDEALAKNGPQRAYVITSWEEMHPKELVALEALVLNGLSNNGGLETLQVY